MAQDWELLGSVIRRHRRRARMSQEDLATASGLSKRTIGNYERGRVPESAPDVPDGYYDVARTLGWTPGSIDSLLAGGEPAQQKVSALESDTQMERLLSPIFRMADVARDHGAPPDLVDRFRIAGVELAAWMRAQAAPGDDRILGEGVAPEDAEELLRALEETE